MNQCPKCGKSNIDFGTVGVSDFPQAWWNPIVSYQSAHKRLRKKKTPIYAMLYLDCGHLEFYFGKIKEALKK